jgi:GNAT superfamily N-acetyltransferase
MSNTLEPELLWNWLAARSIARGLPLPVPEHGGMRVDTGAPDEVRRYLFAAPGSGLRDLASSIHTPRTFIKLCGPADVLRELVPSRWQVQESGHMMMHPGGRDVLHSPGAGYRIEVMQHGLVIAAHVRAQDGAVVARGYAAEYRGVFVYDRIATHAAHRRRGLGRAILAALGARQRSDSAQRVLVATDEGRALYATLGWSVRSPYSTAVIPDPE